MFDLLKVYYPSFQKEATSIFLKGSPPPLKKYGPKERLIKGKTWIIYKPWS